MITREQFALQMDRMIDTWGEKAFGQQREHLIWESVEGLPYANVIQIFDDFLKTCPQNKPPVPADFAQAAAGFNRQRRKFALGEIQPREVARCFDCGDSGFVQIVRREQFEPWAKAQTASAACHCQRGAKLVEVAARQKSPTHFTQFNDAWRNSYSIAPAHKGGT